MQLNLIDHVSADSAEHHGKAESIDDLRHHYLIYYLQNLQTQTAVFKCIAQPLLVLVEMKSRLQVNNTSPFLYICLS